MPDWIVTTVNTSALAGGCLFAMWGIVSIARFLGPRLSRFFEAHVSLIESLKTNLQALTSLSDRQSVQLEEHGDRLVILENRTEKIDEIHETVQEIKHKVEGTGRGRPSQFAGERPPSTDPKTLEKRQP
jgi:hypothetical protein